MTTGKKTAWLEALRRAGFVLVLAWATAPAWAAFDLDALMALLAQRKSGEARFTEERSVSTLATTLHSSGRLSFRAPDHFARYTEEPRVESMEVQGDSVVLRRGTRTRTLMLDGIPELAALTDAMRGTLGGDALALRKHFRIDVSGAPAKWVLLLTPVDTQLARSVEQIEIAGSRADVHSVELRLVGGDRSLMQVTPLTKAPVAPPTTPTPAAAK